MSTSTISNLKSAPSIGELQRYQPLSSFFLFLPFSSTLRSLTSMCPKRKLQYPQRTFPILPSCRGQSPDSIECWGKIKPPEGEERATPPPPYKKLGLERVRSPTPPFAKNEMRETIITLTIINCPDLYLSRVLVIQHHLLTRQHSGGYARSGPGSLSSCGYPGVKRNIVTSKSAPWSASQVKATARGDSRWLPERWG